MFFFLPGIRYKSDIIKIPYKKIEKKRSARVLRTLSD